MFNIRNAFAIKYSWLNFIFNYKSYTITEMESLDIKKFVNGIFAKKGLPAVKNFPQEFADGSKFNLKKIILKD